jgi:hypothetical protein
MATVTNTIKLPDGTTPSAARVEIELVASETAGATEAGWITASDITVLSVARPTVTAGAWTADLTPNANINPSGTVYRVYEYVGRDRYTHYITVGSGGGAVHDLLTSGPDGVMFDSVTNAVATHAAVTATHGATGAVVGTTNTQTLTNKTLTAPAITSPVLSFTDPAAEAARLALNVQRRHMIDDADYDTLQDAADAAAAADMPLWIGRDWTISSTVTFLCHVESDPNVVITYTGTGTALKVVDGTASHVYYRVHLPSVETTKTWSGGSIGSKTAIAVDCLSAGEVTFVRIVGFSYGLRLIPSGPYGLAYNKFGGQFIYETAVPLQAYVNVAGSYVNENRIEIGSYGDPDAATAPATKVTGTRGIELLSTSGNNPINHNWFMFGALEQDHFEYAIYTENANDNGFLGQRFEVSAGFGEVRFGQSGSGYYSTRNLLLYPYNASNVTVTESTNSYGNLIVGVNRMELDGATVDQSLLSLRNFYSGGSPCITIYEPSYSPRTNSDQWNVSVAASLVKVKSPTDAHPKWQVAPDTGTQSWGPGSGAVDTTLSRSAAGVLASNGAFKATSYTTAGRPSASTMGAGAMIYDATLSKPVWSNGTVWKDAAGTTV